MRKSLAVAIACFLTTCLGHVSKADAPAFIPVQGVLTDPNGDPIAGDTTVRFSVYASETGGTALWTETQTLLVEEGLFTVYLGMDTPLDLALFRDQGSLWLGIQVESDSEMARVFLGSHPYAAYAEHCGNAPPQPLPDGVPVGPQTCGDTRKVVGVDDQGDLMCVDDPGGGGWTPPTCSSLQIMQSDGANWNCASTFSSINAGTGLAGGGTSGSISLSLDTASIGSCTNATTDKIYWDGARLACGSDQTGGSTPSLVCTVRSGGAACGPSASGTVQCQAGEFALGGGYQMESYEPGGATDPAPISSAPQSEAVWIIYTGAGVMPGTCWRPWANCCRIQ